MPGNWLYIDTNFPTFTGEESTEEQVDTMLNYLHILVEQLRYSLNNLDMSNFNSTALVNFQEDTTGNLQESLVTINAQISQLNQNVSRLQGRMAAVEGLENRVGDLEEGYSTLTLGYAALAQNVEKIGSDLETLLKAFGVDEDGNAVVGKEGKRTDIQGNVYINGLPV